MPSNLTNEEKRKLSNERQNAVRNAWKDEKIRVQNGRGTRDWSISEQQEIIHRGAVSGYEGHHMKSVSLFPEQAGNPKNIQFLNEDEHFNGAHQGNYHHTTNGYYDPFTKTMKEFNGDELIEVPELNLSEKYSQYSSAEIDEARNEYIDDNKEIEITQNETIESLDSAIEAYEFSFDSATETNNITEENEETDNDNDEMGR